MMIAYLKTLFELEAQVAEATAKALRLHAPATLAETMAIMLTVRAAKLKEWIAAHPDDPIDDELRARTREAIADIRAIPHPDDDSDDDSDDEVH